MSGPVFLPTTGSLPRCHVGAREGTARRTDEEPAARTSIKLHQHPSGPLRLESSAQNQENE